MSDAMWGYLFLLLGIMAAFLLILFGNINTTNETNYYLLKEVTQNAMLDSVDDVAYKVGLTQEEVDKIDTIKCVSGKPGTIRIVTEKFVEAFARRFAEVAPSKGDYKIEFYEINECPAKVSVKIISQQDYSFVKRLFMRDTTINTEKTDIVNQITAILETKD